MTYEICYFNDLMVGPYSDFLDAENEAQARQRFTDKWSHYHIEFVRPWDDTMAEL
jgi:DNA-dependent RNA polymerase auxiliary subunit epsilon